MCCVSATSWWCGANRWIRVWTVPLAGDGDRHESRTGSQRRPKIRSIPAARRDTNNIQIDRQYELSPDRQHKLSAQSSTGANNAPSIGRLRPLLPEACLRAIVILAVLAFRTSAPTSVLPVDGSYLARTLNGRVLPTELRLPVTEGDYRLFVLDQAVLRLSKGGQFMLYFRYYHQLVRRGDHPTSTPVLSDSEKGTFTIDRGRITLTPEKRKGRKARAPFAAKIEGQEIKATYLLEGGSTNQTVTLVLRRDASYW